MHYAMIRRPGRVGGFLILLVSALLAAACDEGDSASDAPQVELPNVEPTQRVLEAGDVPPVVVYLLPAGDIVLGGTSWPLGTGKPEDQVKSLVALRDELRKRTARPELREADGSSKVPLLIHGDRNARWQYVQWIMQVCAEPAVGIYKIRIATRPTGSEGVQALETPLPKAQEIVPLSSPVDELPLIAVKLYRRGTDDETPGNDFTRIRVGNQHTFELPRGSWTGTSVGDSEREKDYARVLEEVTTKIRDTWKLMGSDPTVRGQVRTPRPFGLRVPHGDVVRVLGCFQKAGITDVRLEGTPVPIPVVNDDK